MAEATGPRSRALSGDVTPCSLTRDRPLTKAAQSRDRPSSPLPHPHSLVHRRLQVLVRSRLLCCSSLASRAHCDCRPIDTLNDTANATAETGDNRRVNCVSRPKLGEAHCPRHRCPVSLESLPWVRTSVLSLHIQIHRLLLPAPSLFFFLFVPSFSTAGTLACPLLVLTLVRQRRLHSTFLSTALQFPRTPLPQSSTDHPAPSSLHARCSTPCLFSTLARALSCLPGSLSLHALVLFSLALLGSTPARLCTHPLRLPSTARSRVLSTDTLTHDSLRFFTPTHSSVLCDPARH